MNRSINRGSGNRVGRLTLAAKTFLLVGVALSAMAVAQEGGERQGRPLEGAALNAVTIDVNPLILSLSFSMAGDLLKKLFDEAWTPTTSSFGIGVQYERLINEQFSVLGRFDYMQLRLGVMTDDPTVLDGVPPGVTVTNLYVSETMSSNIWSVEAQARYHPINSFFVGGMLGLAGMRMGYEYESDISLRSWMGQTSEETDNVSIKPWRQYIKLGPVVGTRAAFGGPRGGFVWETNFGYHIAIGLGKSYATRLFGAAEKEGILDRGTEIAPILEDIVEAMELLFMSGPRIASSVGWRF